MKKQLLSNWQGEAFNQSPDSKNEIHSDRVAKQYGFKGGLVPGVTVSAYLIHPGAEFFGMDYLDHGFARVRVNTPLYDEEDFEVQIQDQTEMSYEACLVGADGSPRATAEVSIGVPVMDKPGYRGDPLQSSDEPELPATRENMEALKKRGCKARLYRWNAGHRMSTYLRDRSAMAPLFQTGQGGYANPSFILGMSNWVFAANAYMNPWIHLETRSQNFAAIPDGAELLVEMSIEDLFEKKGHEFADASVNVFDAVTRNCHAAIRLRAIYLLRGA